MYCKECGQIIDDDSKFCRYCGKKQITATEDYKNENQNKEINVNVSFFGKKLSAKVKTKEKVEKYDDSYKKEIEATIIGLVIMIGNAVLLFNRSYSDWLVYNDEFIPLFTIINVVWRIIVTVWVSNIANRQNRGSLSWKFFAFLLPNLSLIIIGLLSKKHKVDKDSKQLNIIDNNGNGSLEKEISSFKNLDDEERWKGII